MFNDIDNITCAQVNGFDECSFDVTIQDSTMNEENGALIVFLDEPLDSDVINALQYMDTYAISDTMYQLQCQIISHTPNASGN